MKLFIIDGNSLCYRAYYAIRQLKNSKGEPTNAVYGFISILNKIRKNESPDMLAVCFDMKGPTFRHEKFKEYKVHRKPMPDELVEQMPVIKEVVRAYNIPVFEMEGYEADDVIATLAKKAAARSIDVFIVTGDKDMLQIVDKHIKVYNTHKEGLIYDIDKVRERYGAGPDKVTDIMALTGDASDNIPGASGIGEKTAVNLIKQFGSLDKLLSNLGSVKSESVRGKIEASMDDIKMSRELVTVDTDVPIDIDLDDTKIKEPDAEKLFSLFKRLEFKNLLRDIAPDAASDADYALIKNKAAFAAFMKKLEKAKEFAFDFETTGTDPMSVEPIGISFSLKEKEAYYISFGSGHLDSTHVFDSLKDIFEKKGIRKIGQNIKYEYIILKRHGITLEGIYFDTMVASYLLDPSRFRHGLDDIALEYLDFKMTPISDLIGKGKGKINMRDVPVAKVSDYSCQDSDVTLRLSGILKGKLKEGGLWSLFEEVEIPLISVLARMEMNGVSIDTKFLGKMEADIAKSLKKLCRDIYEIAGEEFNINSPKQVSCILFDKLGLPSVKKTKTGSSTDEEVLRGLSSKHALPALLLEYRELAKLDSTYVQALPRLINKDTGRVHTSYNQTVTATGRLSSSEPNIQNIPVKTELGRKIRASFVPAKKGYRIVAADYSQIELRILAALSKDRVLIEAFKEGADIHRRTAALVFGVKEDKVTDEMRNSAKTVNFGVIYGISPYGLARQLGIGIAEAKEFIDTYFETYPGVRIYMEEKIEDARRDGYVTTLLNRKRHIPNLDSRDGSSRGFAERTAINTPIQGTAADIIKVAMINIDRRLTEEKWGSVMILQVHDELVFESPASETKALKEMARKEMEGVLDIGVPINVTIKEGDNWLMAEGESE